MSLFQTISFDGFLQNAVIPLMIVVFVSIFNVKKILKNSYVKIIAGVAMGLLAILVMKYPWHYSADIFFDSRSVILAISGAFFGSVPTIIAAIIASVFRVSVGGVGVYVGVLSIIVSSLIGLLLFWYNNKRKKPIENVLYFVFGLIVHISIVMCQFALPEPFAFEVVKSIFIPFTLTFSVLTGIIAIFISGQNEKYNNYNLIKDQQNLLKAVLDSPQNMEIFVLDKEYKYLTFNEYHKLTMKIYNNAIIEKGKSFINYVCDERVLIRLKKDIDKALTGKEFRVINKIENAKGKFYEHMFTPIKAEDSNTAGVAIFSHDVSDRVNHENHILFLSNKDVLTGVFNRRYYNKKIKEIDIAESYPLSLIVADINGLKIFNDAFGHNAGDEVLLKATKALLEVFDKHGFVSRVGGDEFVIVLANKTNSEAIKLISEVQNKMKDIYVLGISVSVSFGIETKKDKSVKITELFTLAEDKMYKNKMSEKTSHKANSIQTILNILYEKNKREERHSQRVSKYCGVIAELLELSPDEVSMLKISGVLHDIGKIAIHNDILNKPEKLTDEEFEKIKKHPEVGYRILSASKKYSDITVDILNHHERFDGKGYPQGLLGEEIPYRSRIISLADAYDAMTCDRPYRKALSKEAVLNEIETNLGKQFDPHIGKVFLDYLKKQ